MWWPDNVDWLAEQWVLSSCRPSCSHDDGRSCPWISPIANPAPELANTTLAVAWGTAEANLGPNSCGLNCFSPLKVTWNRDAIHACWSSDFSRTATALQHHQRRRPCNYLNSSKQTVGSWIASSQTRPRAQIFPAPACWQRWNSWLNCHINQKYAGVVRCLHRSA